MIDIIGVITLEGILPPYYSVIPLKFVLNTGKQSMDSKQCHANFSSKAFFCFYVNRRIEDHIKIRSKTGELDNREGNVSQMQFVSVSQHIVSVRTD